MENFGNSQLKELANLLKLNCARITDEECGQLNCNECRAIAIYEAGWRKQIEAEWRTNSEKFSNIYDHFYCSHCNNYTDERNPYRLGKYCSNCGAKMKGIE